MAPDRVKHHLRTPPKRPRQPYARDRLKVVDGLEHGVCFKVLYRFPLSAEFFQPPGPLVKTPKRPRPLRLNLGDLECIKTLGQGAYARVLLVRSTRKTHECDLPGSYFALKVYSKKSIRAIDVDNDPVKDTERKYLSKIPWNTFVNGVIDVFYDSRNIYMMLEYIPCGTLRSLIHERGRFDVTGATFYFASVACGLAFLEGLDIVHRDLKPENILLGADGYLTLSDFGTAAVPAVDHDPTRWIDIGSPQYMAPECINPIFTQPVSYGATVDWWASGCILFELLTGKAAFSSPNGDAKRIRLKVLLDNVTWPENVPIRNDLKSVVESLLEKNAFKRLGYDGSYEIFSHPFFKKVDWFKVENKLYLAPYMPPSPHAADKWHRYPLPRQTEIPGLRIAEPPVQLAHDARYPSIYP